MENKDQFTLSTSSSTVKVLDVKTVPLVVKHRIAGFRLLAKASAAFALSATLATCSGSKVALDAGGQSLASAPLVKPSSSFKTVTKFHMRNELIHFIYAISSIIVQKFLLYHIKYIRAIVDSFFFL